MSSWNTPLLAGCLIKLKDYVGKRETVSFFFSCSLALTRESRASRWVDAYFSRRQMLRKSMKIDFSMLCWFLEYFQIFLTDGAVNSEQSFFAFFGLHSTAISLSPSFSLFLSRLTPVDYYKLICFFFGNNCNKSTH